MKSAVVQLPGLNRDRDMIAALTKISGKAPVTVWQTETEAAERAFDCLALRIENAVLQRNSHPCLDHLIFS